jgi:hypothetical protein
LLAVVGIRPDLAPSAKEDLAWRIVFYPLCVAFVPLVYWVITRRREMAYPFTADTLLVLPLLVDTVAGVLGIYDAVEWTDDVIHFAGGIVLAAALGQLLLSELLGRGVSASLCLGSTAIAVILWELAQYVTLQKNSPNQAALYPDTLSDMACGLTGGLIGSLLTITLFWRTSPTARRQGKPIVEPPTLRSCRPTAVPPQKDRTS